MPKVTLDREALFALASDTRVEILRTLEPMRRTVTQVAEELGLDKAGVHRHLQKLVEGDLVRREDDHGFVYYGLTWKGRGVVSPAENLRIVFHLALAAILLGAAVFAVLAALPGPLEAPTVMPQAFPDRAMELHGLDPLGLAVGGGLAFAAATLLLVAWRQLRRPRQAAAAG